MKGIHGNFPAVYTKKIIKLLNDPEINAEVDEGQPCDDVVEALQSEGYSVEIIKRPDSSVTLKASKKKD
jgi:hypothetical protein